MHCLGLVLSIPFRIVGKLVRFISRFYFLFLLPLQLAMSRREEKDAPYFELDGTEALGSYLQIQPCSEKAPELLECSIQWYRTASEGGKMDLISGIRLWLIFTSLKSNNWDQIMILSVVDMFISMDI